MPIDERFYDRVADAAMTRNLPKYIELARGQGDGLTRRDDAVLAGARVVGQHAGAPAEQNADDDKQLTLPMDLPLMERPVR